MARLKLSLIPPTYIHKLVWCGASVDILLPDSAFHNQGGCLRLQINHGRRRWMSYPDWRAQATVADGQTQEPDRVKEGCDLKCKKSPHLAHLTFTAASQSVHHNCCLAPPPDVPAMFQVPIHTWQRSSSVDPALCSWQQ